MYFRQCPNILDQLEHFCAQYFGSQEMQTLRTLIYHLINKLMFVYLPLNPEFSTSWLLVRAERRTKQKQRSKSGSREASNAVSLVCPAHFQTNLYQHYRRDLSEIRAEARSFFRRQQIFLVIYILQFTILLPEKEVTLKL